MLNNHYNLFRLYSLDLSQNLLRSNIELAGGDAEMVDEIIKLNVVKEYKNLQLSFAALLPIMQQEMTDIRFFLCLSGEVAAFNYAVDRLQMNANTVNKWQENALHYAALSCNPRLIDAVVNKLAIAWDSESAGHLNILHYAILSKRTYQIDHVLNLEKQHHKLLPLTAKKGRNILHWAALTGDPETVEKVLAIAKERELDPALEDSHGFNALNYAIFSNNQRVVEMFTQLGLKAINQDQFSVGTIDERKLSSPSPRSS